MSDADKKDPVPTQIKNGRLVKKRRSRIVDASVKLFVKQGFHKTTTRQIAEAAEISIGSLYEYVSSKEDILFLVCRAIHEEIERDVLQAARQAAKNQNALVEVIRRYFMVCHRMSDHILLIYQESQSLPSQWKQMVLEKEVHITGIFVDVLAQLISSGHIEPMDENSIELLAHTISALGHMWVFRRWFLSRHYQIEDYIRLQTDFILGRFAAGPSFDCAEAGIGSRS